VILPKYYSQIIDAINDGKEPDFKKTALIFVLNNSMFLVLDKVDTIFMPKLQSYLRNNIVKTVLNSYRTSFEEQNLGVAISQIVKFPLVVKDLATHIRNYIIPLILIFIAVTIRFYLINKKLGILFISLITISAGIIYPVFRKVQKNSENLNEETDNLHENISELFDNLMDIYSMDTTHKELEQLEKHQDVLIKKYRVTFNGTNRLRLIVQVLTLTVFMGCMYYTYSLMKNNQVSKADVVSVFLMSMFVVKKIGSFVGELPEFMFNLGIYNKIADNLSKLNPEKESKENFTIKKGEISFDNVSINYTGGKQILKDFSLNILPKETVIIIGKIGAGKSSLIKALLKLVKYDGNIYLDGVNTKNMNSSNIRSQVLYIRQNPLPFNRSFYENVLYGTDNVSTEKVDILFNKYNLKSMFNKDLNAKVGRKGELLSGGQRMVMFLLRLLIQEDKKIIILDEPTASLDDNTSMIIFNIIKDIIKRQTTIMITHDQKLLNLASKIIKL
tara:strand:+ start:1125 stop:2627 length:1503 start_codon:yes stop_codon:yes gene_type:complete